MSLYNVYIENMARNSLFPMIIMYFFYLKVNYLYIKSLHEIVFLRK